MPFYLTLLWLLVLNDVIRTSPNHNEKRKPALPLWPYRLWPNGIVHYKFNPKNTFNSTELAMVKTCMQSIEKNTCIRFIEKNDWTTKVVNIFKTNSSEPGLCGYALIGYIPFGEGQVAIICVAPFVIYHEIMHTLGFDHEAMRSNQTDYCGKYRFITDETTVRSVKVVDRFGVLNRDKSSEEIDPKFAKKINSLYCCKKKTGRGQKRDEEVLVSSNVEAEVKSLD